MNQPSGVSFEEEPPKANMVVVSDLRKRYMSGVEAIRGISFAVRRAECFALVGPNGAGKSSIARILAGLSRPSAGTVLIAGQDLGRNGCRARRDIGYVAQASSLDLLATGRENLIFQAHLHDLPKEYATSRARHLLAFFGLDDRADHVVKTYSGGLRRRLDIALALVHRPRLLVLDEPTTGLDPESRLEIWHELSNLANQDDLSILLTTHYLEEVERFANRLAIINQGKIIAMGTVAELAGKLGGDRLTIGLAVGAQRADACRILAKIGGLSTVALEEDRIHIQTANGPRMLPVILSALYNVNIAIAHANVSRVSLEEVYLRITESPMAGGESNGDDHGAAAVRFYRQTL